MSELNCHYVSRFLTKPWERTDRQLWYYDFNTKTITSKHSIRLFAEFGLNSPAIERRLNALIETPISQSRVVLEGMAHGGKIEIKRWNLYRALALLLPVQTARIADLQKREVGLESILQLPDSEIDKLAITYDQHFVMVLARAPARVPLMYPSHGFYVLPCPAMTGKYDTAFAIPLEPNAAVVAIPRTCDPSAVLSWWSGKDSKLVSKASVGLKCPMAVIYPPLVDQAQAQASDLGAAIEEHRMEVRRTFELCFEFNNKIDEQKGKEKIE